MKRGTNIRLLSILFLTLALLPLSAAGPAAARATAPVVRKDVKHDASRPLRSITPVVTPAAGTQQVPRLGPPPEATRSQQGPAVTDPVLQSSAPASRMPAPTTSFDGIGATGYVPPDPNADVGLNHIVETVNAQFQIFNKSGTSLYGPANINTLFTGFGGACETSNDGDPIVLYDAAADRWMVSQFALPSYPSPPFYQCIAVSTTGDPTGTWYRYQFYMGTSMNDYGKFGIWPDGYYMTDNEFNSSSSYMGVGVWAFQRDAMLAGSPAMSLYFHLPTTYFGLLPGDIDGTTPPPAGAPNPIVGFEDNIGTDYIDTWDFHVDWVTPGSSTLTGPTQLVAAPFDTNLCGYSSDCIPQPGTAVGLDSLAFYMMYRLAYRNFGTYQSLLLNFTVDANGADHAGIRWTELRKTTGSWSIAQQGTFAPDADHRWMGSIAQDQNGNIALGYSVSSTITYPSIRYAGRLATDPLGSLSQGEAVLQAGLGSQTSTSNRWGDYTSMAVDPSDDCTFWYTNEYYSATGATSWKTRIGSFKFPTCAAVPTTTKGKLTGYYGKKGSYRLYHVRSKAWYQMTVTPNLENTPVFVELWKWDKGSSTWQYIAVADGTLDAASAFLVYVKGRDWGKGKYSIIGVYPGAGGHSYSIADWLYFRFTR